MFTFGNWILCVVVAICGGVTVALVYGEYDWDTPTICTLIIVIVVVILLMFGVGWYNTHTASGARALKDYQSNISNGIERTLKVVADDGYILYQREGKFDIEVHDNYIVFDEKGVRTILYRSLTSTLVIEEKGK